MHIVLEANTVQCNSFILHSCLHVISRFLIVEFQRLCSGKITDAPAVYCLQNNLVSQVKTPGLHVWQILKRAAALRLTKGCRDVAITVVVYRKMRVVTKYTKLANGSYLESDPFSLQGI